MLHKYTFRALALSTILISTLFANGTENPSQMPPPSPPPPQAIFQNSPPIITEHKLQIANGTIPYTATTGMIPYKNSKGEVKASFFYVAYVRKDVENPNTRPIAFCFNGGPGASSVWLHMGLLGPKRVDVLDGQPTAPPYNYIDNPYTLLDVADLVFIDPISTGYSRAVNVDEAKQFHGVDEDIKSVGEFIRVYTTANGRWESPKLLVGESYGTTRAALLVEHLHEHLYMHLNGIVLVSSVLDFQTIDLSGHPSDLSYLLYLPSYTAAAWYHKRLPADLQQDRQKAINEAKAFSINEYSLALLKGDNLSKDEQTATSKKLARYLGVSQDFIEKKELRVTLFEYLKELLKNEKLLIGRFDSRVTGIDLDPCGNRFDYDPSLDTPVGIFTAVYNQYLRAQLNWKSDEEYRPLADVSPWDYSKATNQYLNVTSSLKSIMSRNPALRVFVANGYYDLATPFFATEYTFDHLRLDPKLLSNISMKYYDGGHMMFLDKESLPKLSADLHQFIEDLNPHKLSDGH